MARIKATTLLRLIEQSCQSDSSLVTDSQLLDRYLQGRDEAAFEVLLWRHGSLVLRICQDILKDSFAAEDAFQAAFFVLARKAGAISKRQSLASWLYKVAYRIALKARTRTARRNGVEKLDQESLPDFSAPESTGLTEEALRELRSILYEEIARLPRKYQDPLVLCYLEGKTHEQAAGQLGWPKGSVSGRLARGRDLLQRYLRRRGLGPACGLLLAGMLPDGALAAVPAALAQSTCQGACLYASGHAAAASANVISLAQGVCHAMFLTKLKVVASLFLAVAGLGGAGVLIQQALARDTSVPAERANLVDKTASKLVVQKKTISVVSPRDGIIMVVGTEKPREKIPPDQAIVIRSGDEMRIFKKLTAGDRVEAEQVIARLDDRLALVEVERARTKLNAATLELDVSKKVLAEAEIRFDRAKKLAAQAAISAEDLREKMLAVEKFRNEVGVKKEGVNLAKLDIRGAEISLDMHAIRSPVRGVIRVIHKNRGEGVKAFEPILEIVPEKE